MIEEYDGDMRIPWWLYVVAGLLVSWFIVVF
jgi:hypothetical protein